MNTVLKPDNKKVYNTCKYRIKLWEYEFKKKHGRIPSKLDIREAESDVRLAYKMYFELKGQVLEKSFKGIEGLDVDEEEETEERSQIEQCKPKEDIPRDDIAKINENAWGELENNTQVKEKFEEKQKQSDLTLSFSKKLFDGAKLSKRNLRKSMSFQSRKSSSKLNSKSCSQPTIEAEKLDTTGTSCSQNFIEEFDIFNSNNVKITNTPLDTNPKSLNLIQSVLKNEYKPRSSLDSGWISRVTKTAGTETTESCIIENFAITQQYVQLSQQKRNVNNDSDDLIENSDDDEKSQTLLHISKKRKLNSGILKRQNEHSLGINQNILKETHMNYLKTTQTCAQINNINENSVVKMKTSENVVQKHPEMKIKNASNQLEEETGPIESKPVRKSTRRNCKLNFEEDDDSEREPFASDNDDRDPEFVISEDQSPEKMEKKKKGKKVARTKIEKKPTGTEDSTENTYELEYSIYPRIKTAPRTANVKDLIKRNITGGVEKKMMMNKSKGKMTQKEKFEQKVAAGNLNENFVKIDIKKKVFLRGKKNFSFNKYKKNLWKKHKQVEGCDGGIATCFHCGEAGHFARKCERKKNDALLPLNAVDVEETCSDLPTLEEAQKMACESHLNIRTSNKLQNCKENRNARSDEFSNCNDGDLENGLNVIDDKKIGEEKEARVDEEMQDGDFDDSDDYNNLLLAETIKLEEYIKKLDVQNYLDSTSLIAPYYKPNEDGTIIKTPSEVHDTLLMFGHSSFRPGQEKAIMRILSGKSTLVTLSTGAGKSLCYQLPAYLYAKREPCIALIISPLVSLMEDQLVGLPQFFKAACLHTNQTKSQQDKIKDSIRSGDLNVLLVSPEAVVAGERSNSFGSFLRRLPPIAFACIDEAHCVSQWSHNFRPSYLVICRILRERLGVNVILGLTATATRSTCDNIINHLRIPDGYDGIVADTPLPDHLRLTVSKDANRDRALLDLLLSDEFSKYKSVIVYCTRREECERIAQFLRTSLKHEKPIEETNKKRKRLNLQAEAYHAGLPAYKRRSIQKAFMTGELRIVVATVAFGMGINKSDLRAVIHYNMPNSFEGYVQEVGRAGRDGLPAHCHLFLNPHGGDECELRRHVYMNSIDRHVIRKLLERVFVRCECAPGECPRHEVAFPIQETVGALDIPEENVSTLLCYLELHEKRYVELLSSAYTTCKIISYSGGDCIKKAAKECPPLAMAFALYGERQTEPTVFEFPVVEVASAMGWDSGICKHKLKNLEWTTANDRPKRSSLSVQFANLGFRLLAPGNLTDEELDEALDSLHDRVKAQERKGLAQLRAVHSALSEVSESTYKLCVGDLSDKEIKLKMKIRQYFESPDPLTGIEVKTMPVVEERIVDDTRQLICMYKDNHFTGRAIARIFYGIQSPNYPAFVWGRCKFWRAHLKEDFNEICRIATREIIKMRS